jgi:pyridoxal phosphate enzyme (YggS family)
VSATPAPSSQIAAARAEVLSKIRRAEAAAGRAAGTVTLVAVSKQQPTDRIEAMLRAGQAVFGENRVQEAIERWADRPERAGLELRLIGPLQTNKAKEALELFEVIETLDREKLARTFAELVAAGARVPRLYIQVNTGEEPQKAGVTPAEADDFIAAVRGTYGLVVEGLMCIPPAEEAPGPHFGLLKAVAERNGIAHLSMGMSGDYETAVRFGATSVRVGSALFGARG